MSAKIESAKGMNDLLPDETPYWQFLETSAKRIFHQYGYQEIRLPIVEKTELFCRSIGEVTDIVEKEMYTFETKGEASLSLRPEGTAGCVRAGIQRGLLHNQTQRLWYSGPMFRYEKPQKGRYRQFHQIGAEVFGFNGPDIDAEIIALTARLWRAIGLQNVELQINSLGSNEARLAYRQELVAYFQSHQSQLDEDSQRRLESNPLRILDSKNPDMSVLIAQAPKLVDHLDAESSEHFQQLQTLLVAMNIPFVINPTLVRGLDYYNRTVFEWVTTELGAQGTICAGGRYDGLVEQIGGKSSPAVGFALGMERVIELLRQHGKDVSLAAPDVFVIAVGDSAQAAALGLLERCRDDLPKMQLQFSAGGGSFKSQFKRADKSGANWAIVLGEDEVANGVFNLKPLRHEGEQQILNEEALLAALHDIQANHEE